MTTHTDATKPAAPAGAGRRPGPDRRIWTPKRDATLVALHGTGLSYAQISSHMGISYNAAAARIAVLIRRGVLPAKRGKFAAGGSAANLVTKQSA